MPAPTRDPAYTSLQVPGLPGIRFRDLALALGGRELRLYGASAVDVLARPGLSESPYWCVAWPAGLGLARFLAGQELCGARVLELGCGVGVTALGAALAGAEVLATDNIPAALRVTAMNARRNGLAIRAAAADWRAWPLRGRFDRILGSDVTYAPEAYDALLSVLDQALAPGGEVLLTDPGRLMTEGFLQRARETGWSWQRSPLPHEGPQAVFLYRLRPG